MTDKTDEVPAWLAAERAEAEAAGEAVEVPAGRSEQVLVGRGAPEEEVEVVLPRIADAPVDLDSVPEDPAGGFAGRGLGDVAGLGSVGVVGVDAHGRVVNRGGRPLQRE